MDLSLSTGDLANLHSEVTRRNAKSFPRQMPSPLETLAASAASRFEQRYGAKPRWIAAAPGRVNIIGEHVDYNDGFVLPMAIDRYCVIAANVATLRATGADSTGELPVATIFSSATNEEVQLPLLRMSGDTSSASSRPVGHWSNFVAGVIAGCHDRNMRPPGFQAVIDSNVPIGGGLSSSASIEVATATLFEAITGTALDPIEKALLCQKAEHEYAGVPCGIMDQFASVMGREDHLMLLDCRSQQIEHIPLRNPAITVLIVNTNVKHELSGGEYAKRRTQCESAARKLGVASLRDAAFPQLKVRARQLDPVEFRRARHIVSEIARTVKASSAIKHGDWAEAGGLMYASHDSLRDDFEVSCRELDLLVDIAREIGPQGGIIGSRMTGGGFGGCTVTLVETEMVAAVTAQLLERYRTVTNIDASALTSRPARGAHIVLDSHGG
jgi:galactokinase